VNALPPGRQLAADRLASYYRGMPVCVTGGAGFIGSHLVDALLAVGAVVSVIDDFSNGSRENLAHVIDRIQLVRGSILDDSALRTVMQGRQMVFHQAAIASVPRSVTEPRLYFEVNATGTLRVLEAARELNVPRFIYAASSSAYGDSPQLPKIETMSPLPLSPYASAKFAGEHLLRTYCHCYGLQGVSLRYFNIFGPRQRPDSPYAAVIPRFIDAMRKGAAPVIFGDGTQTRDFTYVDNAVYANLLAGASGHPLRGEHVNIACGKSYSLLQVIEAIALQLGVKPYCTFAPPRIGEVQHSLASIELARQLLGYEPIIGFPRGLQQTIAASVDRATKSDGL
jgi:UDP-glucose 4-epimerase